MRWWFVVGLLVVLLLAVGPTAKAASGSVYHTVRYGETLYQIGWTYGVSPYAIARCNGLSNPNLIYAGQVLYIPRSGVCGQPHLYRRSAYYPPVQRWQPRYNYYHHRRPVYRRNYSYYRPQYPTYEGGYDGSFNFENSPPPYGYNEPPGGGSVPIGDYPGGSPAPGGSPSYEGGF